ncbi:MAG: hypothetical protein ACLU0O_06295 [Collinsella sp.]
MAAHEDIDSAEQSVVVDNPDTPEVPRPYAKTGADAPTPPATPRPRASLWQLRRARAGRRVPQAQTAGASRRGGRRAC